MCTTPKHAAQASASNQKILGHQDFTSSRPTTRLARTAPYLGSARVPLRRCSADVVVAKYQIEGSAPHSAFSLKALARPIAESTSLVFSYKSPKRMTFVGQTATQAGSNP